MDLATIKQIILQDGDIPFYVHYQQLLTTINTTIFRGFSESMLFSKARGGHQSTGSIGHGHPTAP